MITQKEIEEILQINQLQGFCDSYKLIAFRRGSQYFGRVTAEKISYILQNIRNICDIKNTPEIVKKPEDFYSGKRGGMLLKLLMVDYTQNENPYLVSINQLSANLRAMANRPDTNTVLRERYFSLADEINSLNKIIRNNWLEKSVTYPGYVIKKYRI